MKNKIFSVVGVMSGTSLDGCDFVLTQFALDSKNQIKKMVFQELVQKPLPKKLGQQTWSLLEGLQSKATVADLAHLNQEWGYYYAKQLLSIKKKYKWSIDLVGLHGQTIYHQGGLSTWQMGSLAQVASQLRVPVVGDFRSLDVAMGYQGAPLAPLFHKALLGKSQHLECVHNLGGISNTTWIQNGRVLRAFDTGPANMPMDTFLLKETQGKVKFDKSGGLAQKGQIDLELLKTLQKHPYFKKAPPKSAGREQFGGPWLEQCLKPYSHLKLEDRVSTLTEWVAWSIAESYYQFSPNKKLPKTIYFCGGGALNIELLNRVQCRLPQCKVETTDSLGWPVFAVEGACFGYLALARQLGWRWDLSNITGNPQPIYLGTTYEV